MVDTRPFENCKRVIARIWFIGMGIPAALLIWQSVTGHYGQSAGEVWSWFLGAVLPTTGLISAVLGAQAFARPPTKAQEVDATFYHWARGATVVYLLSIWLVILSPAIRQLPGGFPQAAGDAAFWLTPFQGLVTAALGLFFVQKK